MGEGETATGEKLKIIIDIDRNVQKSLHKQTNNKQTKIQTDRQM